MWTRRLPGKNLHGGETGARAQGRTRHHRDGPVRVVGAPRSRGRTAESQRELTLKCVGSRPAESKSVGAGPRGDRWEPNRAVNLMCRPWPLKPRLRPAEPMPRPSQARPHPLPAPLQVPLGLSCTQLCTGVQQPSGLWGPVQAREARLDYADSGCACRSPNSWF